MNQSGQENVSPVWRVGDVIFDRYEVKHVFGSGGMGLVYRVYHRDWHLDLAVKSPRPEFFQSPQQVENFEREAETWVNLGLHPHIVSCYYVRRLGGIPRIFAEFLKGGTLAEWIRTRRIYEGGSKRALERILDIAIQFAWGLHYAHEKGLVHQDVKPGNLLLFSDGTAKVSDFGLARARSASSENTTAALHPGQTILVPGSGFMTPEYASPEQLRGEPLSRKTDIWSWGVSLMEMLLGELTWRSGLAAPAVLAELGSRRFDKELTVILSGCIGVGGRERCGSFEPVLKSLIAYYQSRFGPYRRQKPEPAQLSSDEANNRGVSLADLGRNEEALLALESALAGDPTHVLATYNYALLNQRLGYKSDAFGRDALNELIQRDSSDVEALAASALLSVERGFAFCAQSLLRKIDAGRRDGAYGAEIEAILQKVPPAELDRPALIKVSHQAIKGLRVSSDGGIIAVENADGTWTSHHTTTGVRIGLVDSEHQFLGWSHTGVFFLKDGKVYEWDLSAMPERSTSFCMEIPDNDCFGISGSGRRCFVGCGGSINMFDTRTGAVLWSEELDEGDHNNESLVRGVVFTRDEKLVGFRRRQYMEGLQIRGVESWHCL